MSVEHLAVVLHHSRATGTAKLVLLGIANHAGDGGAWPSVATLARYANTTPRSVQRAIAKLVSTGEVRVLVQQGGTLADEDHTRPNRYDVLVTCPGHCDRTPHHRDTRKSAHPQQGINLGINPLTPVSPPDASVRGGVTPVSPGGVTPVSPKPSIEPFQHQVVSQPQTAREALDYRPCSECSLPQRECERRQTRLHPEDQHPYQPTPRHATG